MKTKIIVAHPEIRIDFADLQMLRKEDYNSTKYLSAMEMDTFETTELQLRLKSSDEIY
ncbi:MAG: hypothetical protein ACREBW_07815 [Candidatus Micrarchaeaceae archaeon]